VAHVYKYFASIHGVKGQWAHFALQHHLCKPFGCDQKKHRVWQDPGQHGKQWVRGLAAVGAYWQELPTAVLNTPTSFKNLQIIYSSKCRVCWQQLMIDNQSLYTILYYFLVFMLFSIYFGLSAAFCRKNCTKWKRRFLGICSSFGFLCVPRLNTVPWDSWTGRFGCGETPCVNGSN